MGEERKVHMVLVGKPDEKHHLQDQGIDGWMDSKWLLGRLAEGGVEWIQLARWWALVNTVMNVRVLAPRS
jgi:hypothetical protein